MAHGRENTVVQLPFYTAKLIGEPKPSFEVQEIQYFDSTVDHERISAIAINQVYPWLKKHGYIN